MQGKQLFFFHRLKAKQETRQKHKTKTKNTKNKANIETERLKHTQWKQTQEQQKRKKGAKNESNLGFKKGVLESMFQMNKQTLGKEKASKRKTKETPQRVFSKKGLMDKKQRKNGFLKGKK